MLHLINVTGAYRKRILIGMTAGYENPSLTVDGILVSPQGILLIRRKNQPYAGQFALPGGFVNVGERVEEAVRREMQEETGLITEIIRLSGVYSDPDRDPRGHTVSLVYVLKKIGGKLIAGDDASEARFFPIDELPVLAFDHLKIIQDYLETEK